MDARRALLERLIDHAPLFPPASLELPEALEADRRARTSAEAWMLGRFVVPASRMRELDSSSALALSVVLDGAARAEPERWLAAFDEDLQLLAATPGVRVEALEVRLPLAVSGGELLLHAAERAAELVPDGAPEVWFEPPLAEGWAGSLRHAVGEIAAAGPPGIGVKLRCGGAGAGAVPSVEQVAAVVAACRDMHVQFKATAGLHHAVRQLDPDSGQTQHGLLNLLAAAVFAHGDGLGEEELGTLLAQEDPAAFAIGPDALRAGAHSADAEAIARARTELFVGVGSCSFAEPVDELRRLGALPG